MRQDAAFDNIRKPCRVRDAEAAKSEDIRATAKTAGRTNRRVDTGRLLSRFHRDGDVIEGGKALHGPKADFDLRAGRNVAGNHGVRAGIGEGTGGQRIRRGERVIDCRTQIEGLAVPWLLEFESQSHLTRCVQPPHLLLEGHEGRFRLAQDGNIGDEVARFAAYREPDGTVDVHLCRPPGGNTGIPPIGLVLQSGQITEIAVGDAQSALAGLRRSQRQAGQRNRKRAKKAVCLHAAMQAAQRKRRRRATWAAKTPAASTSSA